MHSLLVTVALITSVLSISHQNRNTFQTFNATGLLELEDPFEQVRTVTDILFRLQSLENTDTTVHSPTFLQLAATARMRKFHNFCEICVNMMQTKMRGEADLCADLKEDYYLTCVENMESLLRADKALVYWLKNGCIHMDSTGPEVVRPCPAMAICSWVPNLFAQPPFVSEDGVESLCPRDVKFLPSIPQEYKDLLAGQEST